MVIFIDDKPTIILNQKNFKELHGNDFDKMIDARLEQFNPKSLVGHSVILNSDTTTVGKFFDYVLNSTAEKRKYQSVTFTVKDEEIIESHIKNTYKVIKAAGGVVYNDENKILMMYRMDKWDLPKGKRDAGEKSRQTAIREVGEECGISVTLGDKICTTWHTYQQGGKPVFKRTKWYKMQCLDASKMKPQAEEGIDELRWMDEKEVQQALLNSYSSIRFVIESLKKTILI